MKRDCLEIRVDPTDEALLELVPDAAHLNVSAFVLAAAVARAEEALAGASDHRSEPDRGSHIQRGP